MSLERNKDITHITEQLQAGHWVHVALQDGSYEKYWKKGRLIDDPQNQVEGLLKQTGEIWLDEKQDELVPTYELLVLLPEGVTEVVKRTVIVGHSSSNALYGYEFSYTDRQGAADSLLVPRDLGFPGADHLLTISNIRAIPKNLSVNVTGQ